MDELLTTKLRKIRCIVTDVDGCLTKGDIYLGPDGQEMKVFCAKDAPRKPRRSDRPQNSADKFVFSLAGKY